MIFNTPIITVIDDNDHQSVIKISAVYNAANAAYNVTAVAANTLYGANTSMNCIISVNTLEYTSSLSNGSITLEFVSSGNNSNNIPICTFGRANDGAINRYIWNTANNATGDINLLGLGLASGDAFTIVLSVMKEYKGRTWSDKVGAGAWANAQAHYAAGGYG